MKKTPRIAAASLAILTLLGISGCAEVTAQAAVLDNDSAIFVLEQRLAPEAMLGFTAFMESGIFDEQEVLDIADPGVSNNLNGTWSQTSIDGEAANQEIEITDGGVKIYQTTGGARELFWSGSYESPISPTRAHDWISKADADNANSLRNEVGQRTFSFSDGQIFYLDTNDLSESVALFFTRANEPAPVVVPEAEVETPAAEAPATEGATPNTEQLCDSIAKSFETMSPAIAGSQSVEECDANGYKLTTTFPVEYNYTGITYVGDNELSAEERRSLPFRFSVDAVYGDVVFEHDILGLQNQELIQTADEWSQFFLDYSLDISFPGEVTEFSNEGVQATPESVAWDYATIKTAVEAGDYTLSAAGRADFKVNPVPIVASIAGVLFLLVLLVYFMWKRFSPKTIITTSYCLAILSPFGLALALVAKRKSRNNADGAAQATIAIWVTSAVFIFEALVIGLLLLLSPQLVTEFLASIGLASAEA